MRCNQRKSELRVDIQLQGAPWLQAGQVDVPDIGNAHAFAKKHCIAMPSKADVIQGYRRHGIVTVPLDERLFKRSAARPEAAIRFLQDDDVAFKAVDDIQDTARITPLIQTTSLPNVVADNAER